MRILACMLVILLIITGCESESDGPVMKSKDGPTKITLNPVDLFNGEGAKFKLFLGDMSGAFKLRYEGDRPHASLDIDLWREGEKVGSVGSIGDLFFEPVDEKTEGEIEVIVSLDTISIDSQADDLKIRVSIQNESGASLSTLTTPWDQALTARGVIQNQEPKTFSTEEAIHVWGMQSTSDQKIQILDFSPESLSSIEQAIIFTLRFED